VLTETLTATAWLEEGLTAMSEGVTVQVSSPLLTKDVVIARPLKTIPEPLWNPLPLTVRTKDVVETAWSGNRLETTGVAT
jgi:hypothetical protein